MKTQQRLIEANDEEKFEDAWTYTATALDWTPEIVRIDERPMGRATGPYHTPRRLLMRIIDAIRAYFRLRLSSRKGERMQRLAEIRALFPMPVGFTQERYSISDAYCVGGGISLYDKPHLHDVAELRFPQPKVLASVLQYRNPQLSAEQALAYARKIIMANDSEVFETAWDLAAQALAYHVHEETTPT